MKIENNAINQLNARKAEGVHGAERPNHQTEAAGGASARDKAEFSTEAKALSKARATLDETSDIRSDRVQEIKQQVDNGTYQVPVQGLVNSMLARWRSQE